MGYKGVLVDTNIFIDAALYRKPYVSHALQIVELSETKTIHGIIAAHSFDTIFYILRKKYSQQKRYELLDELRSVFDVAPISRNIIDEAIKLRWPDFEDAIHYVAAINAGCEAIVTRNPGDFLDSGIAILTPEQLLADINDKQ